MKLKLKYAAWVGILLVFFSCEQEAYEAVEVPETQNETAVELELLGVVNEHRASLGYNALEFSIVAYEYANKHTDYMIARGDLSHDNFSARASGISSEVNAEYVAENVAKDYGSAVEAFQGWLASSSHRKTMEGAFTHTAVSVKKDGQGNFYFTQLFYR